MVVPALVDVVSNIQTLLVIVLKCHKKNVLVVMALGGQIVNGLETVVAIIAFVVQIAHQPRGLQEIVLMVQKTEVAV